MDEIYRALGQRLRSAREALNLTQEELSRRLAALSGEHAHFSAPMISYYEKGARKLRLEDLHFFAQALRVPVSYFLQGTELSSSCDDRARGVLLRAARYLHPDARNSLERFLNVVREVPPIPAVIESHPKQTAQEILSFLGLTRPPVDVKLVANRLGIHVHEFPFDDSVSGLLFVNGPLRVIGINESHHGHRKRFTLAHEVGHFVKHHLTTVDVSEGHLGSFGDPGGDPLQERQANQFAAELLMPRVWILKDFETYGDRLETLVQRYNVSPQAMWYRLLEMGLVTPDVEVDAFTA